MKRFMQCAMACAVVLSLAAMAAAQPPQPVTRMGDWVEIGDDTFMNIIGNLDIRYYTSHEFDFEKDIQEQMATRNLSGSSRSYIGEGDFMEAEVRFGADFRYQKSLRARILFETQSIFDGNKIDDRNNNTTPNNTALCDTPPRPCGPNSIGSDAGEDNSPHVERFWIDYTFNPMLRMRVGADLWAVDAARWLGDDDPRFAIYITPQDNLELMAAAVVQSESARLGLTNDNDDVYYTFGGKYKYQSHTFGLSGAYFRFRFDNTQRADTFVIMPHANGSIALPNPIEYLVQFAFTGGTVDDMTDGTGGDDYDVLAWAATASVRVSLAGGMVRPFLHIFYASGDDDVGDSDLTGFSLLPQPEVTLMGGNPIYSDISGDSIFDDWGPAAGARSPVAGGTGGPFFTGSPFLYVIGNSAHPGQNTAYSNPGTFIIPVGVSVYPITGHRFTVYYTYVGFVEDDTLVAHPAAQAAGKSSIDKTLHHQISGIWQWTLNRHFDIRLVGAVYIPGEGTKDIAETVTCDGGNPCEGEDIALQGQARFRARF